LARLRADMTSTLICSPFGGDRHALEPLERRNPFCCGLRCAGTTRFSGRLWDLQVDRD
jgi:hypothetical protein